MRRRAAAALLCGPLLAGCGTATRVDFKPHSRPASPVHVSVYVTNRRVLIAPKKVGAGLVTFDATNQASRTLAVWLAGAGGNCTQGTTGPLTTGATAQFTANLRAGAYTIGPCRRRGAPGAAAVRPAALNVVSPSRSGNSALSQP